MTLKRQNLRIFLYNGILFILLLSLSFNSISALALGENSLPFFDDFTQIVVNGRENILRGVYVPNVMALPVVQQPYGKASYVSPYDAQVTQFSMASQFGNIGLLAHNHLSGKAFFDLAVGQEVRLVYGDGQVEYFIVTEILRYQALQPNNPYSSFRNLDDNNETLSAEQMFKRVYFGDRHITFQTCIDAEGDPSWGRLFVLAVPKPE